MQEDVRREVLYCTIKMNVRQPYETMREARGLSLFAVAPHMGTSN